MNNDIYYNTKAIPFTERESFSNTIILLSLVKSQHYYIVGFSRPKSIIEVAFDFESELHSKISESMTIDFSSDADFVLISAELSNISAHYADLTAYASKNGEFICNGNMVIYNLKVKKHKLIPISIEKMNEYILKAKAEIIAFLEDCYERYFA